MFTICFIDITVGKSIDRYTDKAVDLDKYISIDINTDINVSFFQKNLWVNCRHNETIGNYLIIIILYPLYPKIKDNDLYNEDNIITTKKFNTNAIIVIILYKKSPQLAQ